VTDATDSILKSDQTIDGHAMSYNVNLNYKFKPDSTSELTTDFDFGYHEGIRNTFQPNIYMLPDEVTVLNSNFNRFITDTKINIYTLKTDYENNFLKGKVSLGYKLSLVNTDNKFTYFNILGTDQVLDNSRSNHFVYDENVYAGYINYSRVLGKIDYQIGLRSEYTQSKGDLKSATDTASDKKVERNYTDFFPSAGITYNVNQTNSIGIIYSKRIDRPNYQELNPFEYKIDELSFRKGNPFLNPQYSDKVEVSYTYKYATTLSAGYSYTSDFFAQITDTIPGGKSYISARNLATEKVYSLNLSSSLQPLKWYSVYFNAGLYTQEYDADFGNNKTINSSITNVNIYAQNTIKLPLGISFEISGWFNSAGVWAGAYVTDASGSLDLGLQKKFFSDQATLKLSYTDILKTAPWNSHNIYGGIKIRAWGDWESQQFRASFT
jgi:outer membrane receptor protein involved in Fe transport